MQKDKPIICINTYLQIKHNNYEKNNKHNIIYFDYDSVV